MTDTLISKIRSYLEQGWSPELISGRQKRVDRVSLHHETICRYILSDKKANGVLYKRLRHQGKNIVNAKDILIIAQEYRIILI
jgi:IS30 family transposase